MYYYWGPSYWDSLRRDVLEVMPPEVDSKQGEAEH